MMYTSITEYCSTCTCWKYTKKIKATHNPISVHVEYDNYVFYLINGCIFYKIIYFGLINFFQFCHIRGNNSDSRIYMVIFIIQSVGELPIFIWSKKTSQLSFIFLLFFLYFKSMIKTIFWRIIQNCYGSKNLFF